MRKSSLSPYNRDSQKIKKRETSASINSRRLRRPYSSSTDRQSYQKFMKTSYLMSNIKKAVKNNDLKFILGQKIQKLRTQPTTSNSKEPTQQVTHQALIDIRRKYDAMKRNRITKLQQTQILKERLKTYQVQQNQWKEKVRLTKDNSNHYQNWMEDGKLQLQFKYTDKKVLQHMVERLKEDIKFYKSKIVISKRKAKQLLFEKNSLKKSSQKLSQETSNATYLLRVLTKRVEKQDFERGQHIKDVHQMIIERLTKEQIEENRILFQQKQAQNALLAKNSQQKNWYFLFLSQMFVKKMFINKIQKQMDKFHTVEMAFQKIKTNTQTKTADQLVYKFLNRQKIYGELLSEVSKTKQKLQTLKAKNKQLSEQNQQLIQKSQQLLNKQYFSNIPKQQIKLNEQFQNKVSYISTIKIKLLEWLPRQVRKIHRQFKSFEEIGQYDKIDKMCIKSLFIVYLSKIERLLEKSDDSFEVVGDQGNQEQQEEYLIHTNLQNKSYFSTTGYKTKADKNQKQIQILEGLTNNNAATTITYNKGEPNLQLYKPEEQLTLINGQRQQMLQTNEKFMKNLRIRFLQAKQKKI